MSTCTVGLKNFVDMPLDDAESHSRGRRFVSVKLHEAKRVFACPKARFLSSPSKDLFLAQERIDLFHLHAFLAVAIEM